MYFNLNTTVKRCSVVAFLPFITACGNMAPGMRLDAKYVPDSTAQLQPAPVIKLITPSLLQAERAAKAQQANQNIDALLGDPKPYVIGNGDLLSILVWDHPELNIAAAGAQALMSSGAQTPAVFVVDQDGMVQFPYVGVIKLAGLTELDARNTLADKMVKSIKRPDITLRVQSFRSKKIYVDGEVKTPGNQAIDDVPMTLFEGLTRAGGFLPTADQSYVVITRGGVSYPVNLPMLVKHGIDTARIMLAHGDVIRVRSRDENKVYVLGEVNTPRALSMNNGRMTLTEALGEAGGLSQLSSAAGQVYVVRNAGESEPIVYNLDAESPVALALAENFELNPRDVVFVDASGLARFNRVISLIIPSAATVATGAVAATTVSAAKK
jgi:polysaccharide export outer membrane protein